MAQRATPSGSMPPQSVYPGVLRTTRLLSGDRFAVIRQQTVQVEKSAPCELGVRPARTGSSHGANWKSARCELFSVSETISGETRGGRHYAPLGHRAGTGPAPTPESRGRFRERREEAGIVPPWGIGLARGLPLHRSLRSKLRERSD